METKFLKDALFCGMTANAFKLGTVLSLGWFWFRPGGCHNVYRGQDGVMDYGSVQAVMGLGDSQVSIANQNLPAGTKFDYVRRQASGCGLESPDSNTCIVRIAADGDMLSLMPNRPLHLQAESLAGGKVRLRWRYSSDAEEVSPSGFRIYMDSGSGFNFSSPAATVDYGLGGRGEFEWTSGALADGTLYKFCVRSYCEEGTGAELVTNGGFDSDSDWTKGDGWSISDTGWAIWEESRGYGNLEQALDIIAGRTYLARFKVDSIEMYGRMKVQVGGTDGTLRTSTGTYEELITAGSGSAVKFIPSAAPEGHNSVVEIDNVSVREIGAETQNTDFVSATADAVGPDAVSGLAADWSEK